MKTAILTLQYPSRASYYEDWREAFLASPDFSCTVYNIFTRPGRRAAQQACATSDLIIILHSCNADSLHYAQQLTGALQNRRGKLLSFVGNELNMPWAPLSAKIAWLKTIRADFIATQLLQEAGNYLYASTGATIAAVPHALNPTAFSPGAPSAQRTTDIGGRSFRYSAFLGDDDRNRIFAYFAQTNFDPPLKLDLSHEHRFDRVGWSGFLQTCKATIATEAGSFFTMPTDDLVIAVQEYLQQQQGSGLTIGAGSPLHRLAQKLPYGIKQLLWKILRHSPIKHEAQTAEVIDATEIQARFFANTPRPPAYTKAISSRHFDAIGSGTVQIMFPGRYNDILRPGDHYLELRPNFSNIADVLAQLRDPAFCDRLAARTRAEILTYHTYAHRAAQVARLVSTT